MHSGLWEMSLLFMYVCIFGCTGSLSWCVSSLVAVRGLSSWSRQACYPVICGILVPWPGIKSMFPTLESGFSTTGPTRKSQETSLSCEPHGEDWTGFEKIWKYFWILLAVLPSNLPLALSKYNRQHGFSRLRMRMCPWMESCRGDEAERDVEKCSFLPSGRISLGLYCLPIVIV